MNALFATQGLGLRFHYDLANALGSALPLERRGFYVCDAEFQRAFRRDVPEFAQERHVVAEWDILRDAHHAPADLGYLRQREKDMGAGPLWDALICDRRMMQGRWCKERQHYEPRFTHDEFLRILTVALQRIERWFDDVQPDVVFGFVPVSFGEYLISMVAKARAVPALFFYPTKIQNYMCWMDSFLGQPANVRRAYEDYVGGHMDQWLDEAEAYLTSTEGGEVRHEGMIPIPGRVRVAARRPSVLRLLRAEYEYRTTEAASDNHVESPVLLQWHRRVLFPLRRRRVTNHLAARYLREPQLKGLDYVFYPLHAEPEVALSIHGRPYVNQIETVRSIARSLRAGQVLVTKEHPRSIGYRPAGYYDKLLAIPNVRIADPFIESRHIVSRAAAIVTVWSFVGFEGVLARKPVVSLGTPMYTMLPQTMVSVATEPRRLAEQIANACDRYHYDRQALTRFVAACMKTSVRLNFYARFLQKGGRYGDDAESVEFGAFVNYTVARVHEAVAATAARPQLAVGYRLQ